MTNNISLAESIMRVLSEPHPQCEAIMDYSILITSPQESQALVDQLIHMHSSAASELSTVIERVAASVEQLAAIDQKLGCILMAWLWDLASDVYGGHDICDAIDLWLSHTQDPDVIGQMRYLARTSECQATASHFRGLLQCIES